MHNLHTKYLINILNQGLYQVLMEIDKLARNEENKFLEQDPQEMRFLERT